MPYLNLKSELAKRNITIEAIAIHLGLHRNSVVSLTNTNICLRKLIIRCALFFVNER